MKEETRVKGFEKGCLLVAEGVGKLALAINSEHRKQAGVQNNCGDGGSRGWGDKGMRYIFYQRNETKETAGLMPFGSLCRKSASIVRNHLSEPAKASPSEPSSRADACNLKFFPVGFWKTPWAAAPFEINIFLATL